ncbi:conserved phage C-terminal domain-containing protein [Klebsiella variicola]|uniref:conserved phage C-terminal domain-containing protein n=1 Tax=Klebsiella pneumoniae complex TaxID=3390273 RepID=UPI001CDD80A4|nr:MULTISPECIES: conserved phage C-terminal domain-containing protein [Klebsiella]MCA4032914.1 conserved phage C-terminal domain-containing protein [Klebsiella quasipneumoniae]MCJ1958461.1 conserved phage C-terminal domain-containing protein [Klebsiella variicola]HCI6397491.1 conserved phage C-terminal domain-containing protein [Klebsiella pneumoniae]
MSVKLSAYVWDGCAAAGIKGNKLLIMLRLADYASDEGIAYPSVATIARQLGAGRSTVITLIGELVKDGWLTKKERRLGQRSTSNLYTLNVTKLRQAANEHYEGPKSGRSESEPSESGRPESERPKEPKNQGSQGPETGHDPSVNSNTDPSVGSKPSCPVPAEPDPQVVLTDLAKQVLSHLNQTTGSRFQVCATSLEHIRARLREGFTVAEMALVVDYKNEDWKDSEQEEYLRPTTLFIPKNFPGYLKRAGNWDKAGRPAKKNGKWEKGANSSTSASFNQDAGVDIAERDLAWRRYHGLETDNEPQSKIEVKVREKADRDGLKAKGHDHGLAQFGWNNIWSVVAKNGGKA